MVWTINKSFFCFVTERRGESEKLM